MRIIFITANAEPGKDGVGDYSRRLAASLLKAGHHVCILALNDRYVEDRREEMQPVDAIDVPVLRLPRCWGINKQVVAAKPWLAALNPDWLSLQYVPFGFQPKGLPFQLSKRLKQLSSNARWHIMFHELWVGMAKEESPKLIWWGRLQKALIRSLVKNLKPRLVHTQTALYKLHLQQMGVQVHYLPLFGNIPVTATRQTLPKGDAIKFVVFGAIHSGGLFRAFAAQAAAYSKYHQIPISLTFAGRCGDEQHQWAEIWQAEGLPVEILDEQSPQQISKILSEATAGLNTTGLAVVEKSGAFAAMRDHGLPVISLSKPWSPVGVPPIDMPDGIIRYDGENFNVCLFACVKYTANAAKVDEVAQQMLAELLGAG